MLSYGIISYLRNICDIIAFHITALTTDKNFTKCVLTKIKKDKTTEVINFDMNEVDFETLLK